MTAPPGPRWRRFLRRPVLSAIRLFDIVAGLTYVSHPFQAVRAARSAGIAAGLFRAGGLDAVLWVKGAVLISTLALLIATATKFPRLLVWGGAAATSLGLLGFATNSLSIVLLS